MKNFILDSSQDNIFDVRSNDLSSLWKIKTYEIGVGTLIIGLLKRLQLFLQSSCSCRLCTSNYFMLLNTIRVRMCRSHTPATFYKPRAGGDFTFTVSHGNEHFHFLPPAWICNLSLFFFIQRHTEKNEKWDNLTCKTWDSCWNQTPHRLCVYTASLEFSSLYVCVTRSPSSLPVSVPMTPLLPQDRDPSFIWAKLHSLTADWETDSDETTAG